MSDADSIGSALQRLLTAYERLAVVRRRELGLNANEETALLLIGSGVTAPVELSRAIGMTTAGVTNMLDRLAADGLVRREPHDTDKRRVLLTLTKRGFRAQLDLDSTHAMVGGLAVDAGHAPETLRFLTSAADTVERLAQDRGAV